MPDTNHPTYLGGASPAALLAVPAQIEATGAEDATGDFTFSEARAYEFWFALINEIEAAAFVGLERRTMQSLRQRGGGSKFVRISSRCIKYRRADLRTWAEARLVGSTAEPDPET